MRVRCRGGDGEDREQMPACVEDVHRASKEAAARGRLELRQLGAGAKLQLARRAGVARGGAQLTRASKRRGQLFKASTLWAAPEVGPDKQNGFP